MHVPNDSSAGESAPAASPFVKWVGGKRSLLRELLAHLPVGFKNYYEPFVGGGALFFALGERPGRAFLSDVNAELLTAYRVVQREPKALLRLLEEHAARHDDEYYYAVRERHALTDPLQIAARFIYLNKTCYNGLYRVNGKGEFNVPVGRYKNPRIADARNILACSVALERADIRHIPYDAITPRKGDFVYFDPPYHRTTGTSFTRYARDDFSEKDQEALCAFFTKLHKKGVHVMLSNASTGFIRSLYAGFTIHTVRAPRFVNSKSSGRGAVEEVLVTSYD